MKENIKMSDWIAVNKVTGEQMEIDLLQTKEGGSWKKIYAKEFCEMLGVSGNGVTKVFAYMLKIQTSKNEIHGTQREIAEKVGVTQATVNKLIRVLKKHGHLGEIRSGCYFLNPNAIHYGNIGNKMAMLKVWHKLSDK